MEARTDWPYAIVRIIATDAWIPVDDGDDIDAFARDPAFEVRRVPLAKDFRPMLEHTHDGAVRATRELLGMIPLAHFRAVIAALRGTPPPHPTPQPERPQRKKH